MCVDPKQKNLRYIFQASAVAEADRLLESKEFSGLLRRVASHTDYVILDTAPIGAVRDAEVIAASADAALLVIRQDGVRAAEVNDVVDVLDDTGVAILGSVLNMERGRRGSSYSRRGYGKCYYGYGNKR